MVAKDDKIAVFLNKLYFARVIGISMFDDGPDLSVAQLAGKKCVTFLFGTLSLKDPANNWIRRNDGWVFLEEEGVTWVRDWDDETISAFLAVRALLTE